MHEAEMINQMRQKFTFQTWPFGVERPIVQTTLFYDLNIWRFVTTKTVYFTFDVFCLLTSLDPPRSFSGSKSTYRRG